VFLTKYYLGDELEKNEMIVRHVAHMGKRRKAHIALVRNPERKLPLEDLRIGGRLILNFVVKK
jgi:hypothetical protein